MSHSLSCIRRKTSYCRKIARKEGNEREQRAKGSVIAYTERDVFIVDRALVAIGGVRNSTFDVRSRVAQSDDKNLTCAQLALVASYRYEKSTFKRPVRVRADDRLRKNRANPEPIPITGAGQFRSNFAPDRDKSNLLIFALSHCAGKDFPLARVRLHVRLRCAKSKVHRLTRTRTAV